MGTKIALCRYSWKRLLSSSMALTGSGQCVWWKSEMCFCLLRSDFCRRVISDCRVYVLRTHPSYCYTVTRPCIFHALYCKRNVLKR